MTLRGAVILALVSLVAAAGLAVSETPASAGARVFGLYGHIDGSDISTSTERQAVASGPSSLLVVHGNAFQSWITDLHTQNRSLKILDYETSDALTSAQEQDFLANHPTWLARDCNGNLITHAAGGGGTTWLADLTNADFRTWQNGQVAAEVSSRGYDGAFIDVVGAYFPTGYYSARPCHNGVAVTDQQWADASTSFLSQMKSLVTPKLEVANGFGLGTGAAFNTYKTNALRLINASDGVQIEGFTRWAKTPLTQYNSTSRWVADLNYLVTLGTMNKLALALTKVDKGLNPAQTQLNTLRDYSLAEFLLGLRQDDVNGRWTYYSFSGTASGATIPTPSDPVWGPALGSPSAAFVNPPYAKSGCAIYTRGFVGGRDAVNPSGMSKSCSGISLGPHSVLVTDTSGQPIPSS